MISTDSLFPGFTMRRKHTVSAVIFTILLSLTGCIEPAYIQKTETPPNLDGFLGFRWDTPMSILDDHLMQTLDVIPCEHYYDYCSLAYQNFYFMDKKAWQCKFIFSRGLSAAKLVFLPDTQNTYSDLDFFLERLSEIYGSPVQMTRPASDDDFTGYIEGYYWQGGHLVLALLPEDVIVIRACGGRGLAPDAPPIIRTRVYVINKTVSWTH
jgi:hypothetical protein